MEINLDNYDMDGIRGALEDYYGTAMTNGLPFAMVEIINLDNKSDEEIMIEAINVGVNINYFLKEKRR